MELPSDEERDEEEMRKPESVVVDPLALLNGEPDHDGEAEHHHPPCDSWTSREVDLEGGDEALPDGFRSKLAEPPGVKLTARRWSVSDLNVQVEGRATH